MTALSNSLLAPLSALYGAVARTRVALYHRGIFATHQIAAPVISVGNITTGGTGKTPLVAWLARQLAGMGHRVCILTRGYGRSDSSKRVLVSDGKRVLADWRMAGDEPRLLAEILIDTAAVICNADRVTAANWAIANLNSNAFILDDGFQHLAIERDLNLVTIDSTNPWGSGKLLPRGRLREPLSALKRADAIILTRANLAPNIEAIHEEAARVSDGRPVLVSRTHTVGVQRLAGYFEDTNTERVNESPEQPIATFCALGNPQAFFSHLAFDGHIIVWSTRFPDHHIYTQGDADALAQEALIHGAKSLVTTAKDAVKLRGLRLSMPCFVVEIEMTFDDQRSVLEMIYDVFTNPRFRTS